MSPPIQTSLSPAELSYLHTSLSQTLPIRPDGRAPTQFRRLIAETDILPSTNGSARICFADGTEAIVGVKANVEKTRARYDPSFSDDTTPTTSSQSAFSDNTAWLEVMVELPGYQSDDTLPVFLAAMITESLLADGNLKDRLSINSRFHWALYIDVLLLSPPLSYPLPLLSLTTHLALLQTRLPKLTSEKEEDPMFNDDWDAAQRLFPAEESYRPPITVLVMTVGENIFFDATRQELAVADYVLAVSVRASVDNSSKLADLQVVSMRAIDPPARMTTPGVPDSMNAVTGGVAPSNRQEALTMREMDSTKDVWRPPRGGIKRTLLSKMIKEVIRPGGVGSEVLQALQNFGT